MIFSWARHFEAWNNTEKTLGYIGSSHDCIHFDYQKWVSHQSRVHTVVEDVSIVISSEYKRARQSAFFLCATSTIKEEEINISPLLNERTPSPANLLGIVNPRTKEERILNDPQREPQELASARALLLCGFVFENPDRFIRRSSAPKTDQVLLVSHASLINSFVGNILQDERHLEEMRALPNGEIISFSTTDGKRFSFVENKSTVGLDYLG